MLVLSNIQYYVTKDNYREKTEKGMKLQFFKTKLRWNYKNKEYKSKIKGQNPLTFPPPQPRASIVTFTPTLVIPL